MMTDYYGNDNYYFLTLILTYLVSLIFYCMTFFITGSELIENIPMVKEKICAGGAMGADPTRPIMFNLMLVRFAVLFCFSVVVMLPMDVPRIADFAGACFMVPLTMILPMIVKHTWSSHSMKVCILDFGFILSGGVITVWGLYNLMVN